MVKSVQCLGHIVDAKGLHTAPDKIKALDQALRPTNIQQLQALLGLVKYMANFYMLHLLYTYPLNQLFRKQNNWSTECETAFCKFKEQLISKRVLTHYNSKLPLKLACDASPYGVGTVLAHVLPSGEERPIAYGSQTLSKAEQNYCMPKWKKKP